MSTRTLEQFFARPQHLPQIPQVVKELIATFNEPDADIRGVAKQISMDAVITAKTLRLANSARYGRSRQVATVNEAAVRLGLDVLRNMVVAAGMVDLYPSVPHFDLKAFWRQSFDVGELCRYLATKVGCDPELAFTCGMLHNIGELIIHANEPELAAELNSRVEAGEARAYAEHAVLGFTYAEVGAELANRWLFPEVIQLAIRNQRVPLLAEPFSQLSALVYLASYLERTDELADETPVDWPLQLAIKLKVDWDFARSVAEKVKEEGSSYMLLLDA
ncbi:HDOD domain-containing protein [Gallaecimonas sp. GXIMD1310]|uniref:HDOD domain-containing protein n=1 Tax=Gallaecimonas sp. GXIMD1310 TaxID=3131926 RepID=UPI0032493163